MHSRGVAAFEGRCHDTLNQPHRCRRISEAEAEPESKDPSPAPDPSLAPDTPVVCVEEAISPPREGGYLDEELHYLCEKSREIASEMETLSKAHTSLMAQHIPTADPIVRARPASLRPTVVHRHIISAGMTVAPGKYEYVRQLSQQDPESAVIVMCSLPLGPAQTCHAIREHLLVHLPVSSTIKVEVLREMDTCNTSLGVLSIRDKLLYALHDVTSLPFRF